LEESIMAEKSTGKAHGRSRPQAQSRNQKRNPDAGRGNGASRAGGEREEASNRRMRSREQEQQGGQGEAHDKEGQDASSGPGMAGAVGDKIRQHPITSAAIGAGLTLLAAQGLRMAIGGSNGGRGQPQDQDEQQDARASNEAEDDADAQDEGDGAEGGGFTGRLGRIGSRLGSAFGGTGQAIQRGARSGFQRGREGAEENWASHPLVMCGVALAAGLAAGYLIPSTSQEDRLMGETSDKLTGRIKKGGQAFFRQGRSIAGKVVHEAVNTTAESIEREGLAPGRLGKKVKKVFGNVREAVANAIEEE
jgi:hypothetical protein